jgi:hypothetical protein
MGTVPAKNDIGRKPGFNELLEALRGKPFSRGIKTIWFRGQMTVKGIGAGTFNLRPRLLSQNDSG